MKDSGISQNIRVLDAPCVLEKFEQVIVTQVVLGIRTNGGLSYPFLFDNRTVTVKKTSQDHKNSPSLPKLSH